MENGQCMAQEVSDVMDPACFDAGASLLDAAKPQRTKLKDALHRIHATCTQASTQVSFIVSQF